MRELRKLCAVTLTDRVYNTKMKGGLDMPDSTGVKNKAGMH